MKLAKAVIAVLMLAAVPSTASASTTTTIHYVDHTNNWHRAIRHAVANWDISPKVKFLRVNSCEQIHPCFDIYQGGDIRRQAAGVTKHYLVDGISNLYWKIIVTDIHKYNYRGKRSIVCHEIGHVLDVPHGKKCMRYYVNHRHYRSGAYNRSLIDVR